MPVKVTLYCRHLFLLGPELHCRCRQHQLMSVQLQQLQQQQYDQRKADAERLLNSEVPASLLASHVGCIAGLRSFLQHRDVTSSVIGGGISYIIDRILALDGESWKLWYHDEMSRDNIHSNTGRIAMERRKKQAKIF